MPTPPRVLRLAAIVFYWGWNLWFLLWMTFGVGPLVLWHVLAASWMGLVPVPFAVFAASLFVVPFLGLVIGLHPATRADPRRLLALLYGVQVPLMVVLAIRLFGLHQLGPSTALALGLTLVGTAALARVVWRGPRERSVTGQIALLVAAAADLIVGWWFAAWLALYALPLCVEVPRAVLRTTDLANLPFIGLFALTVALIASFPVARVGLTTRAFDLALRATSARIGRARAWGVAASALASVVVAFAVLARQPHDWAFRALDEADTDAERAALLERSDPIRRGLRFARLAPWTTLDGRATDKLLRELYRPDLPAEAAAAAQRLLLAPFVFHPHHSDEGRSWDPPADMLEATNAYAEFFDEPIEVGERDALLAAARSTWDWREAHAGLLDVGEQRVWLAQQEIAVEPRGDLALIDIHEVYRNQTWDQREVVVSFSLPDTAAISGLWLGTSPDRDAAFRYVVAPRGAAQEVYESQVRVRRDPALVEQVGPRQYRLRAFPIEPRPGSPDELSSLDDEGPALHLWLQIVTPMVEAGGAYTYPLPAATEVRNLYWDAGSVRTLDGRRFEHDGWMPAGPEAFGERTAHVWTVGEQEVRAEPVRGVVPRRLGRVAVLVDGTRSMAAHREAIDGALNRLRAVSAEVAVWCTRAQRLARCDDFDPHGALFWGAEPLERRLTEASDLGVQADLLVALTDAGNPATAALADDLPAVQLPPLWMVHFGAFPPAYSDLALDAIQGSGGGVAAGVEELIARVSDPTVRDGYRWTVGPATGPGAADRFAPIAARAAIHDLARTTDLTDLAQLDALHALAVDNHVVTSWSSMLVLVDDAQRAQLAAANSDASRFEREAMDQPPTPLSFSAAPEPASAGLLALGAAGLLALGRRRLTRSAPPGAVVDIGR